MKRSREQILAEVPNIVETYHIGNTTIHIADNYCRDVTPEQVQVILDRIADRIAPSYFAAMEAKEAARLAEGAMRDKEEYRMAKAAEGVIMCEGY